mgnify:CR=1 FL=1
MTVPVTTVSPSGVTVSSSNTSISVGGTSNISVVSFADNTSTGFISQKNTADVNISTDYYGSKLVNKTIIDPSNVVYANLVRSLVIASETISKGDAVKYTGYSPSLDKFYIGLADKDGAPAIGLALNNLSSGEQGEIITNGILKNVDTSMFSPGEALFLEKSGKLSNTPANDGIVQPIAFCLNSSMSEGSILVALDLPRESLVTLNLDGALANINTVEELKNAIGLDRVDNTSDLEKPISIATQEALDAKADLVEGVVPSYQLPGDLVTSPQLSNPNSNLLINTGDF